MTTTTFRPGRAEEQKVDEKNTSKIEAFKENNNMSDANMSAISCMTCGGVDIEFKGWVKGRGNASYGECRACGSRVEMKNGVFAGSVKVSKEKIEEAKKNSHLPPREKEGKEKKEQKDKAPKKDNAFVTLSFRITPGQREVVRAGLDLAKKNLGITGKVWHGVTLEKVMEYFVSTFADETGAVGQSPDANLFTKAGIAKVFGPDLNRLLAFVVLRNANRMFRNDDEKRKYILDNIPEECKDDVKTAKKEARE